MNDINKENDDLSVSFPDELPGRLSSPTSISPITNEEGDAEPGNTTMEDQDLTFVDNLIFNLRAECEDRQKAVSAVAGGLSPSIASPSPSAAWNSDRNSKTPVRLLAETDMNEETELHIIEDTAEQVEQYYKSQIERLELETEEAIAEATSHTMGQFKDEISQLQLLLAEAEQKYDERLEELKKDQQKESAGYIEKLESLEGELSTSQNECESLRSIVAEHQDLDSRWSEKYSELEAKKDALVSKTKQDVEQLFEKKMDELQKKMESLAASYEAKLAAMKREISDLQELLHQSSEAHEATKQRLKDVLVDLNEELSSKKESKGEHDESHHREELENEIKRLKEQVSSSVSSARKEAFDAYESTLSSLNDQVARLQNLLNTEHKHSFDLMTRLKHADVELNVAQQERDELLVEFSSVHEEYAHVVLERDEAIHRVDELELQKADAHRANEILESELEEARVEVEELHGEMEHIHGEFGRVIQERDDAVRVIWELQMKCDDLDSEIIETFEDMEEQHEEYDAKVSSMEREINQLQMELHQLHSESRDSEAEKEALASQIRDLEQNLSTANTTLGEMKKNHEKQVTSVLEGVIERSINLLRVFRQLKESKKCLSAPTNTIETVLDKVTTVVLNEEDKRDVSLPEPRSLDKENDVSPVNELDQKTNGPNFSEREDNSNNPVGPKVIQKTGVGKVSARPRLERPRSRLLQPTSSSVAGGPVSGNTAPKNVVRSKSTLKKSELMGNGGVKQKSLLSKYSGAGVSKLPSRTLQSSSVGRSVNPRSLTTPQIQRRSGVPQTTTRKKVSERNMHSQASHAISSSLRKPSHPVRSTYSHQSKVSPKEIIRQVIETFSPEKENSTPFNPVITPASKRPVEKIEETPIEKVSEKFDDLFSTWSVSKSKAKPGKDTVTTPEALPHALRMNWTSTKTESRSEIKSSRKVNRRTPRDTLKTPSSRLFHSKTPSQKENLSTPYVPKDFMDAILSPEELLISPNQTSMKPERKDSFSKHHEASVLIQSYIRGRIVKHQFTRCVQSAVRIQSFFRSTVEQRKLRNTFKIIVLLQKVVRGSKTRRHFIKTKESCILVQRQVRSYFQRKKLKKTYSSAVYIQSVFRRIFYQNKFNEKRKAAFIIQSKWRMIVQRRAFKNVQSSAMAIQKFARMGKSQKNFLLSRRSAIVIQQSWRKASAKAALINTVESRISERRARETKAATVIQGFLRTRACVAAWRKIISCVVRIQAVARRSIARKQFHLLHGRIIKVQSITRGFLCRLNTMSRVVASTTIQASIRMFLSKKHLNLSRRAAFAIQRHYRAFVERSVERTLVREKAIITIQCGWRCKVAAVARKRLSSRMTAATTIESTWRMFVARSKFTRRLEIESASRMIQRHVRSIISRRTYLEYKRAITKIQSAYRRYVEYSRFKSKREKIAQEEMFLQISSATLIESAWRMFVARSKFVKHVEMESASVVIQKFVRSRVSRITYLERKLATTKIQSAYRGYIGFSRFKESKRKETEKKERELQSRRKPLKALKVPNQQKLKVGNFVSPVRTRGGNHENLEDENVGQNVSHRKVASSVLKNKENLLQPLSHKTKKSFLTTSQETEPKNSWKPIEEMRVVDLKDELMELGFEKKELRNVRKAALIDLLLEHRKKVA